MYTEWRAAVNLTSCGEVSAASSVECGLQNVLNLLRTNSSYNTLR